MLINSEVGAEGGAVGSGGESAWAGQSPGFPPDSATNVSRLLLRDFT